MNKILFLSLALLNFAGWGILVKQRVVVMGKKRMASKSGHCFFTRVVHLLFRQDE